MIFILTGAGISAPSGLATFRDDKEGFWTKYDVESVCSELTRTSKEHYDFFNLYRKQVLHSQPNNAHIWIAELQRRYGEVIKVYTTNIDDLHSVAGCKDTVYLHGCVNSIRCDTCEKTAYVGLHYRLCDNKEQCRWGCSLHGRMRNDVVLFYESLPEEKYNSLCKDLQDATENDLFLVIGTSLSIYPWEYKRTCAKRVFVNTDSDLCEKMRDLFDEVYEEDISNIKVIHTLTHLVKQSL
jgi:NAD-dependent deacetylase